MCRRSLVLYISILNVHSRGDGSRRNSSINDADDVVSTGTVCDGSRGSDGGGTGGGGGSEDGS